MLEINISVITVGMNHLKYIKKLYNSLYPKGVKSNINFESIYVDNCSKDGSVEFLKFFFPQIKIIQNFIPKGFGENNNLGASVAKGKYIAIINPDVIMLNDSLDILYQFMEKNPKVGIAVPHLFNKNLSHQYSLRKFITPSILFSRIISHGNDNIENKNIDDYLCKGINKNLVQPINWAVGASLFISKKKFCQLGGFDIDYFLYMEDEDLCLRSWKIGAPVVYVPSSKMIHNHIRASSKFGKKSLLHLKSLYTFFKKHGCSIPDYAKLCDETFIM